MALWQYLLMLRLYFVKRLSEGTTCTLFFTMSCLPCWAWYKVPRLDVQEDKDTTSLSFYKHDIRGRAPTRGGGNAPGRHFSGGRHFWWKEGIANGLSRMNLKLDSGFRFWLRLDLPYVWRGLSRFKRLSRCPVLVSKMSRNFTSVKFSKLTPAWCCIVMK